MFTVYYVRGGNERRMSEDDILLEFPDIEKEFLQQFDVVEIRYYDNKLGNIIISKMEE